MSSATSRNHAHSVTVTMHMRTSNPLNGSQGRTLQGALWRANQNKRQREQARLMMHTVSFRNGWQYLTITLTRVAPRAVSKEAIEATLKHVRDGIALWLGVDDDDERLCWKYSQRRGKTGEYAVVVEVE